MVNEMRPLTESGIQEWIVSYLARILKIKADEIDVTAPFVYYGLDSLTTVNLTRDLKDWLGIDLAPTLAYEYPNIQTLSEHLAKVCLEKK